MKGAIGRFIHEIIPEIKYPNKTFYFEDKKSPSPSLRRAWHQINATLFFSAATFRKVHADSCFNHVVLFFKHCLKRRFTNVFPFKLWKQSTASIVSVSCITAQWGPLSLCLDICNTRLFSRNITVKFIRVNEAFNEHGCVFFHLDLTMLENGILRDFALARPIYTVHEDAFSNDRASNIKVVKPLGSCFLARERHKYSLDAVLFMILAQRTLLHVFREVSGCGIN